MKTNSAIKKTLIVLAALLVLNAAALIIRYIVLSRNDRTQTSVSLPSSTIGENGDATNSALPPDAKETKLELSSQNPDVNRGFTVNDLFPGDEISEYFSLHVYYNMDTAVYFRPVITEETKELAKVLYLRVYQFDTGEMLCNAPLSEINGRSFATQLAKNATEETGLYYRIDAYLTPEAGNEYQGATLKVNLEWYVENDESLLKAPRKTDLLTILLWISFGILCLATMFPIIFILFGKRNKKGDSEENS